MLTASCARISERDFNKRIVRVYSKKRKNLFFLLRIFIKSQELVFYFNVSSIARQASRGERACMKRRRGRQRGVHSERLILRQACVHVYIER
jgi:hypothetical protein